MIPKDTFIIKAILSFTLKINFKPYPQHSMNIMLVLILKAIN